MSQYRARGQKAPDRPRAPSPYPRPKATTNPILNEFTSIKQNVKGLVKDAGAEWRRIRGYKKTTSSVASAEPSEQPALQRQSTTSCIPIRRKLKTGIMRVRHKIQDLPLRDLGFHCFTGVAIVNAVYRAFKPKNDHEAIRRRIVFVRANVSLEQYLEIRDLRTPSNSSDSDTIVAVCSGQGIEPVNQDSQLDYTTRRQVYDWMWTDRLAAYSRPLPLGYDDFENVLARFLHYNQRESPEVYFEYEHLHVPQYNPEEDTTTGTEPDPSNSPEEPLLVADKDAYDDYDFDVHAFAREQGFMLGRRNYFYNLQSSRMMPRNPRDQPEGGTERVYRPLRKRRVPNSRKELRELKNREERFKKGWRLNDIDEDRDAESGCDEDVGDVQGCTQTETGVEEEDVDTHENGCSEVQQSDAMMENAVDIKANDTEEEANVDDESHNVPSIEAGLNHDVQDARGLVGVDLDRAGSLFSLRPSLRGRSSTPTLAVATQVTMTSLVPTIIESVRSDESGDHFFPAREQLTDDDLDQTENSST